MIAPRMIRPARSRTVSGIAPAAEVIRARAHQALNDLREVIAVLREGPAGPGEDLPHTRLADAPSLVGESRQAGVRIELDNQTGDCDLVPERTGRTVCQIVREALTNSRKHAAGCPVTIRINGAAGSGLTVEIRNPLPGPAKDVSGIPPDGAHAEQAVRTHSPDVVLMEFGCLAWTA
jgi:signal transduction histidine kinase